VWLQEALLVHCLWLYWQAWFDTRSHALKTGELSPPIVPVPARPPGRAVSRHMGIRERCGPRKSGLDIGDRPSYTGRTNIHVPTTWRFSHGTHIRRQ
jgi:hypothetical protein